MTLNPNPKRGVGVERIDFKKLGGLLLLLLLLLGCGAKEKTPMYDPATELKNILSQAMTTSDYDPKSTQSERFVIDHLVEQVRYWETGSVSHEELQSAFAEQNTGNFNLDQWIKSMVDEGHYDLSDDQT